MGEITTDRRYTTKLSEGKWKVIDIVLLIVVVILTGVLLLPAKAEEYHTVNGYLGSQEIGPEVQFEKIPAGVSYMDPEMWTIERFAGLDESYREGFFMGVYFGSVMRDKQLLKMGLWKFVDKYDAVLKQEGSTMLNDAFEVIRAEQRSGRAPKDALMKDFVYAAVMYKVPGAHR